MSLRIAVVLVGDAVVASQNVFCTGFKLVFFGKWTCPVELESVLNEVEFAVHIVAGITDGIVEQVDVIVFTLVLLVGSRHQIRSSEGLSLVAC